MKKTIFLLSCLICLLLQNYNVIFAQKKVTDDYIDFYTLCNTGDSLVYFKKPEEALESYIKAFQSVAYVPADFYRSAIILANELKKDSLAYEWERLSILQGNTWLNESIIKQMLQQNTKDSISKWKFIASKSFDSNYARTIDSLFYIDQCFLRDMNCDEFKFDTSKLIGISFEEIDQMNFLFLLKLIDSLGFPNEQTIGFVSAKNVSILFHHSVRLEINKQYIDYLKNQVKKGNYLPEDFAWMYDQSLYFSGKELYFYFGIVDTAPILEKQKKEINARRRAWGIKPIESYKIIAEGGSLTQFSIW